MNKKKLLKFWGNGRKRQLLLAGVVCLLLISPTIVFVAQERQQTESQAAGGMTVTAGATSLSGSYASGKNNILSATKVTTSAQSGELQSISIYLNKVNTSPKNHIQVGLYADNGSGAPGALITSSTSQIAHAKSWNTIAIGGAFPIAASTTYWIAFNVDGSNTQISWANGSGVSVAKTNSPFNTLPTTYGSITSSTNKPYALYLTYVTPSATATPTPFVTTTPSSSPSGTVSPTIAQTSCGTVSADVMNANTYACPLFSTTSAWNVPATGSVDPNSATMVTSTAVGSLSYSFSKTGHGLDIQGTASYPDYSIPLYYADSTTPRVTMNDSSGWWGGMTNVPMPAQAKPSVGTDHHLSIWDVPNHTIYEFWDTAKNSSGVWSSGLGSKLDTNGLGYQTSPWSASARAYGGSAIAGAIRYQEMKNGVINHALAMAYPWSRGQAYALGLGTDGVTQNIATHSDNDTSANRNTSANIPEGARLRLKSSVDLNTKCGTNNNCKIIGHALQTYGAYIVDNSGVATLYAEVLTGKSVSWNGLLSTTDARAFTASDFEVLALPQTLTNPK